VNSTNSTARCCCSPEVVVPGCVNFVLDSPRAGGPSLGDKSDDPLMPIGVLSSASLVSIEALCLFTSTGSSYLRRSMRRR